MSRDKRDAERAARRAQRLAERAEERARRKERHAARAAERADRLAERVKRRPQRERDLDQSIEDLVDEVTQKAERWIDETSERLFDSDEASEIRRAEAEAERARRSAEKARQNASRAGRAAEELSELEESLAEEWSADERDGRRARRKARKTRRSQRRGRRYGYGRQWDKARRRRTAHLYRDREKGKVCGVCAGIAGYFGRPTWEIRLYAILGLVFIPSVVFPTYFIMYFIMDDKPYYRRVTDRFEETMDSRRRDRDDSGYDEDVLMNEPEELRPDINSGLNNVQAMKVARDKFSDIEQRLRQMETHVTSSRFELQRELKKISGED